MRGTARLLRTNSVKESFELKKKEFVNLPCRTRLPLGPCRKGLTNAQFSSRNTALKNKPKSSKKILVVVRTFNRA